MDSAYLKDLRERIKQNDYPGFLKIWEEYCYGDQPDGEEMIAILESVKASDLAPSFGLHVERLIPLWRELQDQKMANAVLRLIFDLQTTNSEQLAALGVEYLNNQFSEDPLFQDKMRLVGLRNRDRFQGAIRNFELLSHMKRGNFVYHTAGWGTGEVLDVSMIREEITIECECIIGPQHLSFEKVFKTLIPLSNDHFYARRFHDPDQLEQEAREHPTDVIRLALKDLGPKTAAELKEEFSDLIIPASEWNRWWQTARTKLKKDAQIECPTELKHPFRLRSTEISHEVLFHQALEHHLNNPAGVQAAIKAIYTFLRDFPETLKNSEFRFSLQTRLQTVNNMESLTAGQKLSLLFFLEDLGLPVSKDLHEMLIQLHNVPQTILSIEILPFQKRALTWIRQLRSDWETIYLDLLFSADQNLLRDFILQELNTPATKEALTEKLGSLLVHPLSFADILVWYFQKIIDKKANLPFTEPAGQNRFFENLLIVLDHLERKATHRELAKKILSLITADRYKIVRHIMSQSSLEEVKEYLLLATKCETLTDHDIKILHSLGEVVHPTLSRLRKEKGQGASGGNENILWTTQEGYQKLQYRIQQIATVETVNNAKEIETARSHGDLRENAEFKAALERRDRLQAELKLLSDQIAQARIITPQDVSVEEVTVGSIVHCQDAKGGHLTFTLLGPWDADPEQQILSFQSKLAQAMKGKCIGEKFAFQGETFTISDIENYFDQKEKIR